MAEKLYQWIIILFAVSLYMALKAMLQQKSVTCMISLLVQVVGFIWGYACQQFIQTVYILGAGVFLACIVSEYGNFVNYCSNPPPLDQSGSQFKFNRFVPSELYSIIS